jgi:hypothetical protein
VYPELATHIDVPAALRSVAVLGIEGSGGGIARESTRHRSGAAVHLEAFGGLRYAELAGDLPIGQTGCDEAK